MTALVLLWPTPELPYPELHAPASLVVHGVQIKFNAALLATGLYFLFYAALEVRNAARLTGVGAVAVSERTNERALVGVGAADWDCGLAWPACVCSIKPPRTTQT